MKRHVMIAVLLIYGFVGASTDAAAVDFIEFSGRAKQNGDIVVTIIVEDDDHNRTTWAVTIPIDQGMKASEKADHLAIALNGIHETPFVATTIGGKTEIRLRQPYVKCARITLSEKMDAYKVRFNGQTNDPTIARVSMVGQVGAVEGNAECWVETHGGFEAYASTPMANKSGDEVETEWAAQLAAQGIDATIEGGDLYIVIPPGSGPRGVKLDYSTTEGGFDNDSYLEIWKDYDPYGTPATETSWGQIKAVFR